MRKLAKQTLKDHGQEDNEKYTKKYKDSTRFGQSTYVHKGDEQSTINMRVQIQRETTSTKFTQNTWEVHTSDNVSSL